MAGFVVMALVLGAGGWLWLGRSTATSHVTVRERRLQLLADLLEARSGDLARALYLPLDAQPSGRDFDAIGRQVLTFLRDQPFMMQAVLGAMSAAQAGPVELARIERHDQRIGPMHLAAYLVLRKSVDQGADFALALDGAGLDQLVRMAPQGGTLPAEDLQEIITFRPARGGLLRDDTAA